MKTYSTSATYIKGMEIHPEGSTSATMQVLHNIIRMHFPVGFAYQLVFVAATMGEPVMVYMLSTPEIREQGGRNICNYLVMKELKHKEHVVEFRLEW